MACCLLMLSGFFPFRYCWRQRNVSFERALVALETARRRHDEKLTETETVRRPSDKVKISKTKSLNIYIAADVISPLGWTIFIRIILPLPLYGFLYTTARQIPAKNAIVARVFEFTVLVKSELLSFVANIFSYSNPKGIGQIARALGINVNHRQVRNVLLSPCSAVLASYSMHANRIMAEICLSIWIPPTASIEPWAVKRGGFGFR